MVQFGNLTPAELISGNIAYTKICRDVIIVKIAVCLEYLTVWYG
jgi:hypothetical protein